MAFSGHILEEVLKRRLQEEVRLQQEKQAAEDLAMRRQQMADMQEERLADRKYRQDMLDRQDAAQLDATLEQGPISEEAAATMGKSPVTAPRVQRRQIIDARPITGQSVLPGAIDPQPAGDMGPRLPVIDAAPRRSTQPTQMGGDVTASVDTSGPQDYPVRMPTPAQAREALQNTTFDDIQKEYERAATPQQRRVVQLKAVKNKTPLPESLIGETPEEQQKREDATWGSRAGVEHGYRMEEIGANIAGQRSLAAAADEAKRRAAKGDPEAKRMIHQLTLEAATNLKTSPGLKDFTGMKGWQYGFGLSGDDPFGGTPAADAATEYRTLKSLLAIDNLPLLKGPMSDKDIAFIMAMSSALDRAQTDAAFVATLDKIIYRLNHPTFDTTSGEGYAGADARPGEAGPNEPDTRTQLEAARAARRRRAAGGG